MKSKHDWELIVGIAIVAVLAFVLLYVGGWTPVWRDRVWAVASNMQDCKRIERRGYAILSNGFVVRINEHCYGLAFKDRFFDAPVVSWVLFFLTAGGISCAIKEL